MPLKLRVSRGDQVMVGDDCVIRVRSHSGQKVQLEVTAPEDVKVFTVFADPDQQHKNRRKAQQLSPEEQQRRKALQLTRRGEK